MMETLKQGLTLQNHAVIWQVPACLTVLKWYEIKWTAEMCRKKNRLQFDNLRQQNIHFLEL